MIRLLFDIGNSRLKWALADKYELIAQGAMDHVEAQTDGCIDDILAQAKQLSALTQHKVVHNVVVCSVGAKKVLHLLTQRIEQKLGFKAQIVSVSDSVLGIENGYEDCDRLGVDRWVAVIGAAQKESSRATIVVDVGTAITVDYLSSKRKYLGGVIFPGDRLVEESLTKKTAGIRAHRVAVSSAFGRSTSSCVSAGIYYGLPGAVAGVVRAMLHEYPEPTRIFVCGGGGQALFNGLSGLCDGLPVTIEIYPDLLFKGLIALCESSE